VGGEVRTRGRNAAGEPWRIAIERPDTAQRAFQEVVPLSDLAMATSGDYRNFYEQDGVRFSHTIDPRTGRPIQHRLASVSVIDPVCMRADGYATALMVLGEEEGFKLAEEQGLAALFLVRKGDGFEERATAAFKTLFPELRLGTQTQTEPRP
jgi:thiamine biosynthesis lipoprotein